MRNPSKRQILVVDDDPYVRETVALLLISAGYDVFTARNGFDALLQLRKMLPDVIVSDLDMPDMSGFELLSVVRRRFPRILTLAMSGALVLFSAVLLAGLHIGLTWQRSDSTTSPSLFGLTG